MKVLLYKTFEKMFKKIPVFITTIISAFCGFVLARQYVEALSNQETFSNVIQEMMTSYSLFAFLFLAGILVWMLCANSATGLFASEIHEGTLRLLLSKEISRRELVLGKVFGMVLGSIAYLVLAFAAFLLTYSVVSGASNDIVGLMIQYSAVYCLYGMTVIFIVGALGTFLSTCFKKKVPAVLILVAIGALVFGIIPIVRMVLMELGVYSKWHLQYVDMNYHLALIFNQFVELLGGLNSSQAQLGMYSMFTNVYVPTTLDIDISLNANMLYALNQSLHALVVTIVYILGSCGLYAWAFRKMEHKDI